MGDAAEDVEKKSRNAVKGFIEDPISGLENMYRNATVGLLDINLREGTLDVGPSIKGPLNRLDKGVKDLTGQTAAEKALAASEKRLAQEAAARELQAVNELEFKRQTALQSSNAAGGGRARGSRGSSSGGGPSLGLDENRDFLGL